MPTHSKPRLKLVDGQPAPIAPAGSKLEQARARFGRPFAHESGANWKAHPERVLSRWARKADWRNLDPHMGRPEGM